MILIDYVNKNKNCDFKEVKFNEVDALIFAIIPYIDFTGVVTKKITIREAFEKIKDKLLLKTKDKITNDNNNLFIQIANTKRYGNIYLENYQKVNTKTTQFGAISIIVPHHFKYIAFEGTEDSLIGWEEDFRLSYEYPVKAQSLAINYLNENIKLFDILVYVGGHSKGGNLAIAALMDSKHKAKIRSKYVFNFDGPGFLPEQIDSKNYTKIISKIRTYVPEESVVGMLLEQKGKVKVIKSKAHRINQHNGHSWQVFNNKFVNGSLSNSSKGMHNKTLKLLDIYTKEQRKFFVKSLFTLLYKSGYSKKSEIGLLNINKLKNIIHETRHLKAEEKKIIIDFAKVLIASDK